MSYSAFLKEKLLSLIREMEPYHWLFTRSPEKDFSRIRKWSFSEVIRVCVRRQDCADKPARLSMDSAEIEQRFRAN